LLTWCWAFGLHKESRIFFENLSDNQFF
jgi:hypothetical protein